MRRQGLSVKTQGAVVGTGKSEQWSGWKLPGGQRLQTGSGEGTLGV